MIEMKGDFNSGSISNIGGGGLFAPIHSYLAESTGPVYIIVPFISNHTIERLLNFDTDKKVSIVTSWRSDYLRTGVSSLDLYPLCKRKGWTLYVNSRIHCKVYSDSFNSCIITSANCTDRALSAEECNIECCTMVKKLTVGNRFELNKIISESILIDDCVYEQYLRWFDTINQDGFNDVTDPQFEDLTPYYSFQLPACKTPSVLWEYIQNPDNYDDYVEYIEHDLAIYSSNPFLFNSQDDFLNNLRQNFINHPFIKKIDELITTYGVRFGEFKAFIHQNCSDVPLPYRSEITVLVQNLYNWFIELFPDTYYWDIPGTHSQVMYRRDRSVI